ncbi:MAG: HlyU family transcriptional regulator [Variibacter sp.]
MSFLKKLFGLGTPAADESGKPAASQSIEYNGFTIRAEPYKEGGQYQTAGVIAQEIDGVMKEHRFVRADRYAALDDAVAFTLTKGKQIVDEYARLGGTKKLFD